MDDIYERDVACPLCGSRNHRDVRQHPDRGMTFVECVDCSMRYYSPRFKEQYALDTYARSENGRAEALCLYEKGVFFGEPPNNDAAEQKRLTRVYYDYMLKLQVARFRDVNRREPTSMFEVGCSIGLYLEAARDLGYLGSSPRLAGCDANSHAAQLGREKMALDLQGCTLTDYPESGERYDLITALDYIEHTYTPRQDLEKLYRLAKPGGVMLLKTFLEEMDPAGSYVHPVFHVGHFYGRVLRKAIEDAGWHVLVWDDEWERKFSQVSVYAAKPHRS